MDISIEKIDDNSVKIVVSGESTTIINMLKHKLLEDKDVSVAGYRQEHPLIDKIELFVEAKKDPVKCVKSALKELGKEWSEIEIK